MRGRLQLHRWQQKTAKHLWICEWSESDHLTVFIFFFLQLVFPILKSLFFFSIKEIENWVLIGKMIDKVCFWAAILLFIIGTVAIFLMGHFNRAPDFPFPGLNKKFVPPSAKTFWSSATLPSVSRPHASYTTEQISLQPEHQDSDDSSEFIYIYWVMYNNMYMLMHVVHFKVHLHNRKWLTRYERRAAKTCWMFLPVANILQVVPAIIRASCYKCLELFPCFNYVLCETLTCI